MYYAHFGLKEPPFKITPNTEVFFTGGNRGAVLDAITYAILNGEGIIKIVGEVGSGKTMLCRMLQAMLPERVESIYLANPSVAPEDVLHAIAFELQLKLPRNADRLKVMQALQKHLLSQHAADKQVVIFVEEAQGMPLATLEEIRLLSNLETKHDKLLQIVLFGQPELDENLNQTNIRQLRERITHSFNLAPLQFKEIEEYLIFRLRAAGYYGPHLFSKRAIKKISNAAQGLVRRVNILADKALLAAFADNVYQITPKHVDSAILDSEFGIEKSRSQKKKFKLLGLAALLLLGLLLGYFANVWYSEQGSQDANGSETKAVQQQADNQVAEIQKNTSPTSIPSATNELVEVAKIETFSEVSSDLQGDEDILSQRLRITNSWLNNQPSKTVSIQLMGSADVEQLRTDLIMLSQKVELDKIYVYRTQVNNAPFLNVLYGDFSNRADAIKALKKLPIEIQKNKPQLRTVAGVLQETNQLP